MAGKLVTFIISSWNFVLTCLEIGLSLLLTVLFLPVLLVVWLLNEIIRVLIISPLLKLHCAFSGRRLSLVSEGADNVWSFKKPGNSRNILILTIYTDLIDPEKYRQNFVKRVLNFVGPCGQLPYNKLKRIYTKKFGYNCWEKKHFNIQDHIKILKVANDNNQTINTIESNGQDKIRFHPNSNTIGAPIPVSVPIPIPTPIPIPIPPYSLNSMPIIQETSVINIDLEPESDIIASSTTSDIVTESQVMKLLGQLALDMNDDKPQWEDLIIPKFVYDHEVEDQSEDQVNKEKTLILKPKHKIRSARIFRCHHGYMDGASFLLMTSTCMSDQPFPYTSGVNPLAPRKIGKNKHFFQMLACVAFGVLTLMKTVFVAATVKNRFVTRKFHGEAHHTWSDQISVKTIQDVREATKSSFPAIFACVTAGAIRKLDERFPARKRKTKTKTNANANSISADTSVTMTKQNASDDADVEINMKLDDPNRSLLMGMIGAVCPYPDCSPRNRYTVINFQVSTANSTRLQRLELMKEVMKRLGGHQDFMVNLWMFQFFGRFPHFFIDTMMRNGGSPIVVSNTPWAQSTVSLMGDQVEEIGGWIPLLTYCGLGLLVMRYCETLRFCAVSEDACLTEEQLKFVVSEIENEMQQLAQEVLKQNHNHPLPLASTCSNI